MALLLAATGIAFSGAPAQAYPAGNAMAVEASQYQVDPGSNNVSVRATRAYPGCTVTFTSSLNNVVTSTKTAVAASTSPFSTPYVKFSLSKLGLYTIQAKYTCGSGETATANVQSGRITTTAITSFTNTGTTSFTVVGTIKVGNTGVALSGTAVITDPSNVKTSFGVKSGTNGSFTASKSLRKAPPGQYSITVTFPDKTPYIGSFDSSSLTKSQAIVLSKSAKLSPKIK